MTDTVTSHLGTHRAVHRFADGSVMIDHEVWGLINVHPLAAS